MEPSGNMRLKMKLTKRCLWRFCESWTFSRIQFEKRIEDYSGGQKKKVLIAGSLCKQAHLYIWDEPLNFIDVFSRMQIEELILKFKPTMILVEHDRVLYGKCGHSGG